MNKKKKKNYCDSEEDIQSEKTRLDFFFLLGLFQQKREREYMSIDAGISNTIEFLQACFEVQFHK